MPWYLRSGKYLAKTATEVLVELKSPPQRLFADSMPTSGRANSLRFRLSPNSAIALAARVKHSGKEFIGDQRELYLLDERPGEESPCERLLGDAMAGDGSLFTREDAVEAAWAVVDPVLKPPTRLTPANGEAGGRKRLICLSLRAAVGTTLAARTHPDDALDDSLKMFRCDLRERVNRDKRRLLLSLIGGHGTMNASARCRKSNGELEG
jgi:glucose-6-phosphate dehydrogenase-like protein